MKIELVLRPGVSIGYREGFPFVAKLEEVAAKIHKLVATEPEQRLQRQWGDQVRKRNHAFGCRVSRACGVFFVSIRGTTRLRRRIDETRDSATRSCSWPCSESWLHATCENEEAGYTLRATDEG